MNILNFKKNIYRFNLFFIIILITSCGGGGGGGKAPPASPIGDVAGIWLVNETDKNDNCLLNSGLKNYALTVRQDGNNITVIDEEGYSYSGTLSGANLRWTGSYEEDAPDGTPGRTSLNPMSSTVAASCNTLSGSANWTWTATDGSGYSCSGTTSFNGTRSAATGCGDTPNNTDTTAPSTPTGLLLAASSISIDLNWSAANDNVAVTGYNIYRNGNFYVNVNGTSYSNTGLLPSTRYCYTLSAYDAAGNESARSAEQCITTMASSGDTQAPTTPTGLAVNAVSSSQINLNWNASTDNVAVSSYNIYRDGSFVKAVTGISATDTNLTASTNYCYRVNASDAAGNSSSQSVQVCESTSLPSIEPPARPTNLSSSNITHNSARISWTDNATNETGYEIGTCSGLVGSTGEGWTYCAGTFSAIYTLATNSSAYTLASLQASTSYTYYVRAVNSAGNSFAIQIRFTTDAAPATTVTNTYSVTADNLIIWSSTEPSRDDTAYASAENAVGCNYFYNSFLGTTDFVCFASLIFFDVDSDINNKTIISATLKMYPQILPADYYTQYRLRAIYDIWSSSVTWNARPLIYNQSDVLFNLPTSSLASEIDVTNIVQNWANGTYNNYGFFIEDANYVHPYAIALRATSYCSKEGVPSCTQNQVPQLIITYQ